LIEKDFADAEYGCRIIPMTGDKARQTASDQTVAEEHKVRLLSSMP
jgi:hypothetical protein